jgi:hypothetical protein
MQNKDGQKIEERDSRGQCESTGTLGSPNYNLIARLKPANITSHECWWGQSRSPGVYVLGSARAELENSSSRDEKNHPGHVFMTLDMAGKSINDCHELYELIRAGDILPVLPYEEKQMTTPIHELRDLFRILFRRIVINIRSRMAA